jgi:hypothetical protein
LSPGTVSTALNLLVRVLTLFDSEGELLCKMAAFYGARITPNPKEASHVLVGCQQSSFTRSRLPRKAEFITVDWLRRCLNSKELEDHSMDED